MSKKKAAKLGLTAAVAASAFVAGNPADAAATTAEKLVTNAENAAKQLKAFYGSTSLEVSADFTAKFSAAKAAVAKAKAAKLNTAQAARVQKAEEEVLRAARYIDAVKVVNNELQPALDELQGIIDDQEIGDEMKAAYDNLSEKIRKAERVIGKVYGAPIREAFLSEFVLPAKIAKETVIYEVSRFNLLNVIDAHIKADELKEAEEKIAMLERLEKRSVEIKEAGNKLHPGKYPELPEIEKALVAKKEAVVKAYEEKLAPAVVSVSAINANTVEVTGTGLNKLTAENFSLEGNKVTNYNVNAETGVATLTFEKKFESGKEQTLKLTEKVEGQEDKVSEFKFTYTLEIKEVKALTTQVDESTDGQKLEFAINGETKAADLSYIKASGYTVEFLASKNVFADKSTGELDENLIADGDKFDYQVVIKDANGNEVAKTDLVTVTVKDYDNIVSSINGYAIKLDNGVEVKSGKIALSDTASITDVIGTLQADLNNKEASLAGKVTFKSSNENIAVIDNAGNITPIQPGSVTFTIAAGDVKVQVPVTIVAEARTASKVVTDVSSAKLVNSATKTVNLTVTDQYGEPVKDFDLGVLTVNNKDNNVIATTSDADPTDVEGKTSFVITADATNVGTGTLQIKNGDKVLSNITLTVAAAGEVTSRKIELASGTDYQLDKAKGSQDNELVINWNQYNKDGFLIKAEDDFDTDGAGPATGTYSVKSTDEEVATVAVDASGNITVTAGTKKGSTTIQILEGDIVRASVNVTVVDTTPTITGVKFETVEKVTTAGSVEVLKLANVTISDPKKTVLFNTDGTLYIEVTGTGYDADDDITLGKLDVVSNVYNNGVKNTLTVTNGTVGTFASGDEGTFVVKVTRDGETVPVATSTFSVDVE
jgi:hypothetical protein